MVDLSDICGDTPLRASLVKKREKAQGKLDVMQAKHKEKIAPILADIEMYNAMITAIDRREGHAVLEQIERCAQAIETGDADPA